MTAIRVRVSANWGLVNEWYVIVNGRHIGSPLDKRDKAVRIACKVTAALRDEGISVAPVVTIPDATALRDYINEEIETEIESLGDYKHRELVEEALDPNHWMPTLGSIKVDEDGVMVLDFDQATAAQELLPQILEATEDYDDDSDDPDPISTTLNLLRGYARQLEAAGFPFEQPYGPDGKYVIKLADESQGDPYVVWADGGEIGTVQTLNEGWKLIQKLAGPPVESQLKLPTEESK